MSIPNDRKYTKDHEWIRTNSNEFIVGITEFAQKELGEVVYVDPPSVGKQVRAGESLCVVESTKAASDVYAPVSGKVVAINTTLKDEPSTINKDPYEMGWLVKLEVTDPKEIEALMTSEQYKSHIRA